MIVSIYALSDPRDGFPFYVGQTSRPLAERLSGHVCNARKQMQTGFVMDRVRDIAAAGLRPEIFELERVPRDQRFEAERFWINSLRLMGTRLLNAADGASKRPSEATRGLMSLAQKAARARGASGNDRHLKPLRVAVIVDGERFESIAAATQALHVCRTRVAGWLKSGRAQYAEPDSPAVAMQRRKQQMLHRQKGRVAGDSRIWAKPVTLFGRHYRSQGRAAAALGLCAESLRKLLRRGGEAAVERFVVMRRGLRP
jgi:hypothetical protein